MRTLAVAGLALGGASAFVAAPAPRAATRPHLFGLGKRDAPAPTNAETFKPKLGSRVDDALAREVTPQKGPTIDFSGGGAKMAAFYGVLAAAVGLALTYSS